MTSKNCNFQITGIGDTGTPRLFYRLRFCMAGQCISGDIRTDTVHVLRHVSLTVLLDVLVPAMGRKLFFYEKKRMHFTTIAVTTLTRFQDKPRKVL